MKDLNNLAPTTAKVFLDLSQIKEFSEFVFVGGSALSVYLKHRISEDIDLFTWKSSLNKEAIYNCLNQNFIGNYKIINLSDKQIDTLIYGVKVTFFANAWVALKNSEPFINQINIASLELLTAMKLNTLFLRAKYRDYYDLYVINKEVFTIHQMYDIIVKYMPSINKKLFQMALIFIEDSAEDNIKHLKPNYKVTIKRIQKHFEQEIKKLV